MLVTRIEFMAINYVSLFSQNTDLSAILSAFIYGIRLDLSMSAYLTVLPFLLLQLQRINIGYIRFYAQLTAKFYLYATGFLVFVIGTADAILYSYWSQKLSSYAASFARFPADAMSYTNVFTLIMGVLLPIVLAVVAFYIFNRWHNNRKITYTPFTLKEALYVLLIPGLLFLCIRGGWGKSTINPSSAYYSSVQINNHMAVNSPWYFLSTVVDDVSSTTNPYEIMPDEDVQRIVDSCFIVNDVTAPLTLTDVNRPNIVLVILEGVSANVTGCISGKRKVTPQLDQLASEGLLFTSCYASGNRTDKGLAAIFCSEPSLARQSIVNHIDKFAHLSSLSKQLNKRGYASQFYYGGDLEFANMKAFLLNIGISAPVDKSSIHADGNSASWGLHDLSVYNHVLKELSTSKEPFFSTILTLTSHDPFDVPYKGPYLKDDYGSKYINAVQYADSMLGAFMTQLKSMPAYKNTLVCIVSDHGHTLPDMLDAADPKAFHIPLIFTGGALHSSWKSKRIDRICSQLDIATTLLNAKNYDTGNFMWSRNLLDTTREGSAVFRYNDGTGLVNSKGTFVWDNNKRAFIHKPDSLSNTYINSIQKQIQAIQQIQYKNYLIR